MEQAKVVIVGAGPAGLVLGLSLQQRGVKSILLERQVDITEDPRGVYLAGDAVRILYSLGLGADMPTINFHSSSFANPPFHQLDLVADELQQAVPTGILQVQPALEKALRSRIQTGGLCELGVGCDVQSITSIDSGAQLNYTTSDGISKQIQTEWLIGADGKRGTVRKKFLENAAGIRQEDSAYRYEGTWVAANLKISLPTPETHPNFPAWQAGMTPQEVYDLFWPKGWHFCCPPGKSTATSRFGSHEKRLWLHEFRQDDWQDSMDATTMLWEHLDPMVTRSANASGVPFTKPASFPRDCIEVLRCRPFAFTHKVVNRFTLNPKWFHKQTVLIGDAAHVFPPFGGQGIASGIRDAHQLAWRIALIQDSPEISAEATARILDAWAKERVQSVAVAASFTKANGMLCNTRMGEIFWILQLTLKLGQWVTWSKEQFNPQRVAEQKGFQSVEGGFFLPAYGGGKRLPQIYVNSIGQRELLSDEIFTQAGTPFRLLAIVRGNITAELSVEKVQSLLLECEVPPTVLKGSSLAYLSASPCQPESIGCPTSRTVKKFAPTAVEKLSTRQCRPGYDIAAFEKRLGSKTKFVIVRPDLLVFAMAQDLGGLRTCLRGLAHMTSGRTVS